MHITRIDIKQKLIFVFLFILHSFLHIKIDEGPISSDIVKRCLSTKLQIVVICSTLIALPSQFLRSQLSFVIRPDVALSVLLNTTEEQMLQSHKYCKSNGLSSNSM